MGVLQTLWLFLSTHSNIYDPRKNKKQSSWLLFLSGSSAYLEYVCFELQCWRRCWMHHTQQCAHVIISTSTQHQFSHNACVKLGRTHYANIQGCIQKFLNWLPEVRTANGTALCHYMQLYHYLVSKPSEFCYHNPLCCFSMTVYCCKRIFCYWLSPETFGYTLIFLTPNHNTNGQCFILIYHHMISCLYTKSVSSYCMLKNFTCIEPS